MSSEEVTPVVQDPNQEQLFDPDAARKEEELARQVDSVYRGINYDDVESSVGDRVLTDEQRKVHELALQRLSDNEEIPEGVKSSRDWSDNERQHNEKQAERRQAAADVITARLVNDETNRKQRAEQEAIQSRQAAERAHVTGHNDRLAKRDAEQAERQQLREQFLRQQQFKHGEGYMKLFADEMSVAANKHVDEKLGPEKYPHSVADTEKLKAEKENSVDAGQERQQKIVDDIQRFRRGFNRAESDELQQSAAQEGDAIHPANNLSDAEVEAMIRALGGGDIDASTDTNSSNADRVQTPDTTTPEADQGAADVQEPIVDDTPRGIRGRIRNMMASASAWMTRTALGTNEYFQDQEKGRRRRIVGAVVGAVAAGGALYLSLKMGLSDHAPKGHGVPQPDHTPTHVPPLAHGGGGGHHVRQVVELKPGGDSYWREENQYLHKVHPNWSPEHVERATNLRTQEWLHQQHMTEADAEHMAVGAKVKLKK